MKVRVMNIRVGTRRIRRPQFSFALSYLYQGGEFVGDGRRFRFSWETAQQRWRAAFIDFGWWRLHIRLWPVSRDRRRTGWWA